MKSRTQTVIRTLICSGAVLVGMAFAQNYTIDRWTIDGGGVMRSTGGAFELSGTIGQPDAGQTMTGGAFELTGGFWFPLTAGDCNEDGGVTLFDHEEFDTCLSGPGGGLFNPHCNCFDLNQSGDVELSDFSKFQTGFGH
jgi:hypothetical protein